MTTPDDLIQNHLDSSIKIIATLCCAKWENFLELRHGVQGELERIMRMRGDLTPIIDEKFKSGFDSDHSWKREKNSQIFAYNLAYEMLKLDSDLPEDILRRLRIVAGVGPVTEFDIRDLGYRI